MIYRVELAPQAERDLVRLVDFLAEHSETAVRRAGDAIKLGLRSLARMPVRTRRISDDLREFDIRFGNSGYVVQFRVKHDTIVIARVFHMREDPHGLDD